MSPRPSGTGVPLSYAQERVWFMDRIAPGEAAYHVIVPLRVRGELDVAALRTALGGLMRRHEALRTRFPSDDDGSPAVVIEDTREVDLRRWYADDEATAWQWIDRVSYEPFDLATGPLLRAVVIELSRREHFVVLAQHHIISDGWSVDVLIRDLIALYHGDDLPELPVQYGDFAYYQQARLHQPATERDLAYWHQCLAGTPPLELPADYPRPAIQTYAGDYLEFTIDTPCCTALRQLAAASGCTLFMVLLAAYQVLLARYSGQDDFAVGVSVAGRSEPELEDVVGMFANMLPLRAELSGDPSFAELLERTRSVVLDGFDHGEVPFAKVVHELGIPRDVSRSPVFQAMFALQNYEMGRFESPADTADPAGTSFDWIPVELRATRFDFELHMVEIGSGLYGKFLYNTDLFDRATVERILADFRQSLSAIIATPDTAVSGLELLAPEQRTQLLHGFNDTTAALPEATTLHGPFERQARLAPEMVALRFDGRETSYGELNVWANRIAHRLIEQGVGPETLVAVCAQRSPELVAGLLGVLKSGAAYVPLDPEYPAERLAFMLTDSAAPVVLTQHELAPELPSTDATVLLLDTDEPWTGADDRDPWQPVHPDNLAYVLYTSGSTGRPKGAGNTHRGIANRLSWTQWRYQLDDTDAVLQKTPASFDVSVWEFFWPLWTGALLVLAEPGGHKDAAYLRRLIVTEAVTTTHFVPSMLSLFLAEAEIEQCASLRRVLCSGEELPVHAARELTTRLPNCELHNLYGPTEAAIDVSSWHCDPAELAEHRSVPIGSPIANTTLYVLDARLEPVPIGVSGELHIGGIGLARGYHARAGLTAERFLPDPHGRPGSRLYRTGDLARWRADGTIEFLGRVDHQVKLRGQRIELGEVDTTLREQPGITDAVTLVREDTPGDKRLVAYTTGDADPVTLKTTLKARLPEYMVPATFVCLAELPRTPNGKLDRDALPAPTVTRDSAAELVEPRGPTELMLARIWSEALRADTLGIDDDFFDLGGHSMLATQVVARIHKENTGRAVGVMDLFQHRTIRQLAGFMSDEVGDEPRGLLHELTRPVPDADRVLSYVCVPYGGGSAIVFQPLADELPAGYSLYSVALPGHDVGIDEQALPFEELTTRIADEIVERVEGPLALYGHCVGSAIIAEVARQVEQRGRELDVVYIGGSFPFARPKGALTSLRVKLEERLKSNRRYADWLKSLGVDTDELEPDQIDRLVTNMRHDARASADYFTDLLDRRVAKLSAPIISIVGSEDPITDYYLERYEEWQFLTDTLGLVVLDQAGHYFLKHRADELAEVLTRTHPAIDSGDTAELEPSHRGADAAWTLRAQKRLDTGDGGDSRAIKPSMTRFLTVTIGQLVSTTGSALAAFALPLWLYQRSGSVLDLGLLWALALLCGVVMLPVAGALADRIDRRLVMLAASCFAGALQLVLAALLWMDSIALWHVYALVALTQATATFQRVTFQASIPQLVPKRFLGHAMGIAQLTRSMGLLMMPLLAAGLLAVLGLSTILLIDVASYAIAIIGLLFVRFPDTLGFRPKEPLLAAIAGGLRYSWNHKGFRALLAYFAVGNLFLAPALVLVAPLVLSFATVTEVAQVALAEALGGLAGGGLMALWGGPRHRRVLGVLIGNIGMAVPMMFIGLAPSVLTIAIGVFGLGMALSLSQSIYGTIVQVKVPQRYHARVFSLNQTISWSTLPIGFALLAPAATALFEPMLAPGGALADSVGSVIGVGDGRGIAFAYIIFGLLLALRTAGGYALPILRNFDTRVPDSLPDDLIGVQSRKSQPTEDRTPTPV